MLAVCLKKMCLSRSNIAEKVYASYGECLLRTSEDLLLRIHHLQPVIEITDQTSEFDRNL